MSKRDAIIGQARELISEIGFKQFTLEQLLQKMKLSKGGFYHHFKRVDLLFEAMMKEDLRSELQQLEALCNRSDAKEALRLFFTLASVELSEGNGLFTMLEKPQEKQRYLHLLSAFWDEQVKDVLRRLIQQGITLKQLPQVDVDVIVELFEAVNKQANRAAILELWGDAFMQRYRQKSLLLLATELGLVESFFLQGVHDETK